MKRIIAVCFAALALSLAGAARGEDAAARAKAAFEEGKELFEAGEYARAADAFRRADAIRPNWKLLYNIGQCEAAAKRFGLALDAFERYLVQGGDEIDRERQGEVREELVRLRDMVGFVRISAPEGAMVLVDGVERGLAPLDRDLPVAASVGHTAEAVVDGETVARRVFQVSGGRTGEVDLTAPTPETREPEPASRKSLLWPVGWVGVGLGGALLVGGGVTGGLALRKDGDLSDECPGGTCYSGSYHLLDQRDRLAAASTALFVTGGAIAAAGAVLLIIDATRGGERSDGADVSLLVGPGGVALTGRF